VSDIEIFFCYDHNSEDESLVKRLEKQLKSLKRLGLIDAIWYDQLIGPGQEPEREVDKHLNSAQIILLLVSSDFIASDKCHEYTMRAMARSSAEKALVIPVILRPTLRWEKYLFGKLKALPSDNVPVTNWPSLDDALLDVAEGIAQAVESIVSESPTNLPAEAPRASLIVNDSSEADYGPVRIIAEHLGPVASVSFSPDGELLVSDSWDKTIKIWDRFATQPLFTFSSHAEAVYSVIFSPDRRNLASGSDDCTVKIWDTYTGQLINTFTGHNGPVSSVAFSPDKIVMSGSDDCTIKVWDIHSGRLIKTFTGHTGPISSISLSSDGRILISGSHDMTVKIWNAITGQVVKTLSDHTDAVSSVALSSDGKTLVSGSHDKTVKIWDISTGQVLRTLLGHSKAVSSIALSSDGKTLVSGSHDKTLKIWNISTGEMLKECTGHQKAVLSVAFHPKEQIIVSGSLDKTIRIWQAPSVPANRGWTHSSPNADVNKTFTQNPNVPPKGYDKRSRRNKKARDGLFIRRICPSCLREFYPGDCEIVSGLPGYQVLELAPNTFFKKLFARTWPKPLTGAYAEKLAHRRCYHCGYLLPFNIEQVQNISIAIVGDFGSGKSHYLAALIHQIRNEWVGKTKNPIRFTCITPDAESDFFNDYLTPLFKRRKVIPSTIPAIEMHRKPLIYELSVTESMKRSPITVNLILYDIAGEDLVNSNRLVQYGRHVLYADAIICLADPIAMPDIYHQLPPHLQQTNKLNHTASDSLNSVLRMFERVNSPKLRTRLFDTPIAIVVSKSDLLKYIRPVSQGFGFFYEPTYSNGFDVGDRAMIDSEVKELVEKVGDNALLHLASAFSNVQFFAASATGYPPGPDGTYPEVQPVRCLDPLLWILYKLHIVKV